MMRAHVLTFILCATAAAAACSSDDVSPGGAVLLGEEGGAPDGASPLADGASRDGTTSEKEGGALDGSIDASVDAADAADAAEPPPTYKHYDINHVLSTGASDSVANGASAYLTTTQPFQNISFDVGVMTSTNCNGDGCPKTAYQTPTGFAPLVEGDKFFTYGVETMSSGLANQAHVFASDYFTKVGLAGENHVMLMSHQGRSGNPYWCERLQVIDVQPGYGPCYFPLTENLLAPFDEALMQVQKAKDLATTAGKTYVVRAVTVIAGQGESDSNEQNFTFLRSTDGTATPVTDYTKALFDWQWDYDTKVKEITGQTEPVVMFISQFGSMTTPESIIPQRQLTAHVTSGGKINVVSPNYPLEHYTDCLHYTAHSQRKLGAYFAKAYERVVIEGKKWEPTRPLSVTRAGAVLTVKYVVPVPPLVIDTTRVAPPVAANYTVPPVLGFIFRDSTMSAAITNVAVTAPDTVTVTLSNAPTGANPVLRYAYERQSANACPGPTNGARGNIRDSDPTVGYYNDAAGNPYELFNWSVAYELPVP